VGALRAAIWALALLTGAHARAGEIDRWQSLIDEASARFGVPAAWIERVMSAESRGRTRLRGRPITSSAGAMGLMQLMPGTWADMRRRLGLGSDPHDRRLQCRSWALWCLSGRHRPPAFGNRGLHGCDNTQAGRGSDRASPSVGGESHILRKRLDPDIGDPTTRGNLRRTARSSWKVSVA
jgi:hypothetical protein